jgi:hypothetical protein
MNKKNRKYLLYTSGSIFVAKCTTWTAHAVFSVVVEQCACAGVRIKFSGAAEIARQRACAARNCPSATYGAQCRCCGASGSPDGTVVAGDGPFVVSIRPRETFVTPSLSCAAVGVAALGAVRTGENGALVVLTAPAHWRGHGRRIRSGFTAHCRRWREKERRLQRRRGHRRWGRRRR